MSPGGCVPPKGCCVLALACFGFYSGSGAQDWAFVGVGLVGVEPLGARTPR